MVLQKKLVVVVVSDPSALWSTSVDFQLFMVVVVNCDCRQILYIFVYFVIQGCGTLSKAFLLSIQAVDKLFSLVLQSSSIILSTQS